MAGLGFDFKLIGLEKVIEKLKSDTIKSPLTEGIRKVTIFLNREVKKATPIGKTGILGESITSQATAFFGKVGTYIPYAEFVEYGRDIRPMEPRHLESGHRVFGLGMFGYAMQRLQEKLGDFLKDIGKAIEVKFG